jgi:hypothetical protein
MICYQVLENAYELRKSGLSLTLTFGDWEFALVSLRLLFRHGGIAKIRKTAV